MEEERDGRRKICLKIQKGWCIYPLKYNCHLSLPAEELFCQPFYLCFGVNLFQSLRNLTLANDTLSHTLTTSSQMDPSFGI